MKHTRLTVFLAFVLSAGSLSAQEPSFESASQAVQHMGTGWNLGNTLDSHADGITDVTATETLRGQPVTTPELMEMLKMAGFGTVRIPVTWYPHTDADGNIDAAWLARVRQVADYVLDEGMYCIVDLHHDTGKEDAAYPKKAWLKADMANYNANRERFEHIWRQIATAFSDCGQRLLFEGYNELLDPLGSWNYASYNADGRYDAATATSAYDAVNAYARSFVQAVRSTGGNNAQRNLIVNTYGACPGMGTWSDYLAEPLARMEKPEDSEHILFGVHAYVPIVNTDTEGNILSSRSLETIGYLLDGMMSNINTHLKAKGAPVVISEWNTSTVDRSPTDYDQRREHLMDFAELFLSKVKANGMAACYWMGLTDKSWRSLPAFHQPDLAGRLLRAWHGDNYAPTLLTADDYATEYHVAFNKQWGELQLAFDADGLEREYTGVELELSTPPATNGGTLSMRAYATTGASPYQNLSDITTASTVQPFSAVTTTPVARLSLVWRSAGSCTIDIKGVRLVRSDGTKESVVPVNRTPDKCTVNVTALPLYGIAKVGDTGYATLYYGDKNLTVPEGITATACKVEDGRLTTVKTYPTGTVVPAGTGVVLRGQTDRTYKLPATDESGEPATGNMLRGSDAETLTTGGGKYYRLSLNNEEFAGSIGFYYGAPDGEAFLNQAHNAYLVVPADKADASGYPFDEPTMIENSTTSDSMDKDSRWYTLEGILLHGRPSVKGIYLHNRKKVVIQ